METKGGAPQAATLVVLGAGWGRTAGHGRDIGRSYAAIAPADEAADNRPVSRWLGTLFEEQPITYGHFAHLRAVATGKMRMFDGLTEDRDLQEAYLRAFETLAEAVTVGSAAGPRLCRDELAPGQVLALLGNCFWMVPDARLLVGLAKAAHAGDPVAGSKLRLALGNLRGAIARTPAVFFLRSIGDLSATQYRTILARRGFHPSDMADAARAETDFSDLSTTLAAIREKVNAGFGLDAAANEVSRLGAISKGLDA